MKPILTTLIILSSIVSRGQDKQKSLEWYATHPVSYLAKDWDGKRVDTSHLDDNRFCNTFHLYEGKFSGPITYHMATFSGKGLLNWTVNSDTVNIISPLQIHYIRISKRVFKIVKGSGSYFMVPVK